MRTLQRWKKIGLVDRRRGPKINAKAISQFEEQVVLQTLKSEHYCNDAPELVVAKLADTGIYLCSQASMYRILKKNGLNKYRRRGKAPVRKPMKSGLGILHIFVRGSEENILSSMPMKIFTAERS
jgi:putative transposase